MEEAGVVASLMAMLALMVAAGMSAGDQVAGRVGAVSGCLGRTTSLSQLHLAAYIDFYLL
jgi:hypothetical protein